MAANVVSDHSANRHHHSESCDGDCGHVFRMVVMGAAPDGQPPHVGHRTVHLFSCGLRSPDRDGFHFPRTELAFLLVAQPVAHTLGEMMSGDPSRSFKWVTVDRKSTRLNSSHVRIS